MDELDAVIEQFRRRTAERRAADAAAVKEQAALRAECAKPLLDTVPPVLEEVAEKLRTHGHKAEVKTATKPWAGALLSVELAGHSAQESTLGFDCAPGERIRCNAEIWGPKSERWSDEVPLSALTADEIRGITLRFVREVLEQ